MACRSIVSPDKGSRWSARPADSHRPPGAAARRPGAIALRRRLLKGDVSGFWARRSAPRSAPPPIWTPCAGPLSAASTSPTQGASTMERGRDGRFRCTPAGPRPSPAVRSTPSRRGGASGQIWVLRTGGAGQAARPSRPERGGRGRPGPEGFRLGLRPRAERQSSFTSNNSCVSHNVK